MVVAISYVIAVILTGLLACVLYPISGLFWLIGLLGKIGENLFSFTNKMIKNLWADISSKRIIDVSGSTSNNSDNQSERVLLSQTQTEEDISNSKS